EPEPGLDGCPGVGDAALFDGAEPWADGPLPARTVVGVAPLALPGALDAGPPVVPPVASTPGATVAAVDVVASPPVGAAPVVVVEASAAASTPGALVAPCSSPWEHAPVRCANSTRTEPAVLRVKFTPLSSLRRTRTGRGHPVGRPVGPPQLKYDYISRILAMHAGEVASGVVYPDGPPDSLAGRLPEPEQRVLLVEEHVDLVEYVVGEGGDSGRKDRGGRQHRDVVERFPGCPPNRPLCLLASAAHDSPPFWTISSMLLDKGSSRMGLFLPGWAQEAPDPLQVLGSGHSKM